MKRSAPLVRKTPLKPGKGLKPSTKRMRQRHRAIGKPTDEQQEAQDALRAKGCAMCRLLRCRRACGPVRIHHSTTGDLHGQKQLGQGAVVPLGDWHHQGVLLTDLPTRDLMRAEFGPSLHHHKRDFLNLLDDLLGERSTAALQRYAENLP